MDRCLVSDLRPVTRYVLPAVPRTAVRPGSHMNLCRRGQPAHVSHIRGTWMKCFPLIQGRQKCIHGMASLCLHRPHLLLCRLLITSRDSRNGITSRVCHGKRICEFIFLPGIFRHAQLLIIIIQCLLQHMVAHRIRQSVDKLPLKGRVCHQRRALGDPIHPLLQFHCLRDMIRAHHIEHTGPRLNHIRAAAARIRNRIMNPRFIAHMLSEKLYPDIHQLHGIQRTAPPLGSPRRMRGCSGKFILYLNTGIRRSGPHLVDVLGMPGQRRVQILPYAVPGHKCFRRTALLPGTAIENHRTRAACSFQICLYSQRCRKSSRPQQVVAAAMSGSSCLQFLPHQAPCLLGKP